MLILIKMPVHRQPFPNVSVSFRIRVLLQPIDERGSRERERERERGGEERARRWWASDRSRENPITLPPAERIAITVVTANESRGMTAPREMAMSAISEGRKKGEARSEKIPLRYPRAPLYGAKGRDGTGSTTRGSGSRAHPY